MNYTGRSAEQKQTVYEQSNIYTWVFIYIEISVASLSQNLQVLHGDHTSTNFPPKFNWYFNLLFFHFLSPRGDHYNEAD